MVPINPDQPDGVAKALHSITECPRTFITNDSNTLLAMYIACHTGSGMGSTMNLPEPGGIFDQPAILMEAFGIIRHEQHLFEEEQRKKRDKERQQQQSQHSSPSMTNTTGRRH